MRINKPIAIAVMLFAVALLTFFFVVPKYKEFRKLQQTNGEKQAEFNAKYAYYSEIAKMQVALAGRKEALEKIDNALPSASSFGSLIHFFTEEGTGGGLIIRNLFLSGYSPVSPGSSMKEIAFSLDVIGTYTSLKNFVDSLESSARLFEVKTISFASPAAVTPASLSSKKTTQFNAQETYSFRLDIRTHSY